MAGIQFGDSGKPTEVEIKAGYFADMDPCGFFSSPVGIKFDTKERSKDRPVKVWLTKAEALRLSADLVNAVAAWIEPNH